MLKEVSVHQTAVAFRLQEPKKSRPFSLGSTTSQLAAISLVCVFRGQSVRRRAMSHMLVFSRVCSEDTQYSLHDGRPTKLKKRALLHITGAVSEVAGHEFRRVPCPTSITCGLVPFSALAVHRTMVQNKGP